MIACKSNRQRSANGTADKGFASSDAMRRHAQTAHEEFASSDANRMASSDAIWLTGLIYRQSCSETEVIAVGINVRREVLSGYERLHGTSVMPPGAHPQMRTPRCRCYLQTIPQPDLR